MKIKDIKTKSINRLKSALLKAAREFFQSEMIDTGMKSLEVGEGKTFFDVDDWLDSKIREWLK